MQVGKRLKINIAFSIITALLIALVLFLALVRVSAALKESEIANEILSSSFERSTFKDDFILSNTARARVQWFAKHEQIGKLLSAASERFRYADDKKIIDAMIKDQQSTTKIFSDIVKNRERMKSGRDPAGLSQEIESRLVTQLNMKLYDKVLFTGQLHESAERRLFSTLTLAGWRFVLVIAVLTAAATINSWTLGRTIMNRIRLLRDGASIVGQGNLDHKIEIKGRDEFAELSNAFNAMTGKLRGSYYKLENEIAERAKVEKRISELNKELSRNVYELTSTNKELESFIYSVAHDLRAPLRSIGSFSEILLTAHSDKLDDAGRLHLRRVVTNAGKMNQIIDDLLNLSRIARYELHRQDVDISGIARSVISELQAAQPERRVVVDVKECITGFADARLIQVALSNLLGNAWKFTSKTSDPRIEFGGLEQEGKTAYFVKDNGSGFDQGLAAKMFLPFHRLHTEQEYEGTGVGLAIVERVIRRHGGRIWAEGKVNQGAAFFFTLN